MIDCRLNAIGKRYPPNSHVLAEKTHILDILTFLKNFLSLHILPFLSADLLRSSIILSKIKISNTKISCLYEQLHGYSNSSVSALTKL